MNNVILVNTYLNGEDNEEKLSESKALLFAAKCNILAVVTKKVIRIDPATYLGKGKLSEIKDMAAELKADAVIFDVELSPSQTLNVSDIVEVVVITKTNLILDIFAHRAVSNEGKILVELAQLKYLYPRLKGKGDALSRQGGGIGTVGPGETKLETDRRYIRGRILSLERSLKEIQNRQKNQQSRRNKNNVKVVAIVGYTNVGKSTLINKICGSTLYKMDEVFATLDTTARMTEIKGKKVIFIDTVGFIKDLPKSLVEAFKSTLESAKTADLILCVSDVSKDFEAQRTVTDEILNEIEAKSERIYAVNKCDLTVSAFVPKEYLKISAENDIGLDELNDVIFEKLFGKIVNYEYSVPYLAANELEKIKRLSADFEATYNENEIIIKGTALKKDRPLIKKTVDSFK